MKAVAIICEYNPLHSGHKFHIDSIKKEFGSDTYVVAVMSSCFVQRGEPAVFDKYTRAEATLMAGADLVLELPCPYSFGSAEYFAFAGVYIADAIGVCDTLSFGSESGSADKLFEIYEKLSSKELKEKTAEIKKGNPTLGYMHLREEAYKSLFGEEGAQEQSKSNNILAFEYIKAIKRLDSKLEVHTILRKGDDYNDTKGKGAYVSASFLRDKIKNGENISKYVPGNCAKLYYEKTGDTADISELEKAVLSHFRLADPKELTKYAEVAPGLEYRLVSSAKNATSLEEFFSLAASKKYTNARIRRALLSCMLGVYEDDFRKNVPYTRVLAANARGQRLLKKAKKISRIPIVSKLSKIKNMGEDFEHFNSISERAESLFTLSQKNAKKADEYLKKTPVVYRDV